MQIENPAADAGIVTISIGVATIVPSPDSTVEQLINRADQALYAAKRGGRNSVLSADDVQD
ncbi:diguanylate cyclase [compost metagenome]